MDTHIASLENTIHFLQERHRGTLEQLHREIDHLKRKNKDLQFKLIMEPPRTCRKEFSRRGLKTCTETQTFQSERGIYLNQTLEDACLPPDTHLSEGNKETPTPNGLRGVPEGNGGLITSLEPLRIHSDPSLPPRAPTLKECEVIIRQLFNANSLQSREIVRIKAVLRDIIVNKRITPENYILTKAYLAGDSGNDEDKFPKLPLRPLPKRSIVSQASVVERVTLPALKHSHNTSIADRQKRIQALQKNRLRRTVRSVNKSLSFI
ncbi:coiled-coil domain-containing protein 74B [Chanos chanos]|uniref:Coiled-coil domain-containing protein 74B n=1 Tax=Chanos chanos TaxID=29144 RepID=A0A6J2UXT9_CHACN|nr:coiled-coil domain-containing protein 74B [Chanos chanos]